MIGFLRNFSDHPHVAREIATSLGGARLGLVSLLTCGLLVLVDGVVFQIFSSARGGEGAPLGAVLHLAHCFALTGVLLFTLPLRVSGLIEGARIHHGFDQLVVTGVSPVRLQAGNSILGLLYAMGILAVSVPFTVLALSFGGVDAAMVAVSYARLLLFATLLIALVLAGSVVEREWFSAVGMTLVFVPLGAMSMVMDRTLLQTFPAALAELLPLRAFWRQSQLTELFEVNRGLALSTLAADPVLFHERVPLSWYSPLLAVAVIVACIVPVLLGPNHQFRPGLNTFGSVVLPGDRGRFRLRRLHWILARRVELRFLYENRPRWAGRWEGLLRSGLDVAFVTFCFATVVGGVYGGDPRISPGRFGLDLERDELYHLSFWPCCLILWAWIVVRLDSRLRTSFVHALGPLRVRRSLLQTGVFAVLLSLLFLVQWRILERAGSTAVVRTSIEDAAATLTPDFEEIAVEADRMLPTRTAAIVPVQSTRVYDLEHYRAQWWRITLAACLGLVLIFLAGRVLSFLTMQPIPARLILIGLTSLFVAGTAAARFMVVERGHEAHAFFVWIAALCPIVLLESETQLGWPLAERVQRYFVSYAVVAMILVVLLFLAWRRARRLESRTPVSSAKGAAALLVFCLIGGSASASPWPQTMSGQVSHFFREWMDLGQQGGDGDLALGVDVVRGFGGNLAHSDSDFFTIELHNPGGTDLAGTFWLRGENERTDPQEFFLSRSSRRTIRWRRPRTRSTESLLEASILEFEVGEEQRRIALPAVNSIRVTGSGWRNDEATRWIVVASPEGRAPVEWMDAATQMAATVVVACKAFGLPTSAADYVGLHTLVLCDVDLASLTGAQRDALYDFVRLGGSLVFAGRFPDLENLSHQALRALLTPESRQTLRIGSLECEQVIFAGGQRIAFELPPLGEVPFASVRRRGPGVVAASVIDPRSPSSAWIGDAADEVNQRRLFWTVFQAALPGSAFPMQITVPQWDGDLQDSTACRQLLVILGGYGLILGSACFLLARRRARGWKLFLPIGGVITLFALLLQPAVGVLTDRPSRASLLELLWWSPGGEDAVQFTALTIRSAGRREHEIEVSDEAASAYELPEVTWTYDDSLSKALVSVEDRHELRVEPWERGRRLYVADSDERDGPSGRARIEPAQSKVSLTLDPAGRTLPKKLLVLVSGARTLWNQAPTSQAGNAPGLQGQQHLFCAISPTTREFWPPGEFTVELAFGSAPTSPFVLEPTSWGSFWQSMVTMQLEEGIAGFGGSELALSPLSGPRVLVLWADEGPARCGVDSPHLDFFQEMNTQRLARLPEFQRAQAQSVDRDRFRVRLQQRVVVCDIPLELPQR